MTSLYDILKANRLGMDSDPWIAILGEAWKASEEDFKEYTGLVPYTFIANGQPLIDWYIKGNMSQTGTPTPSSPIQPSETGERTENLFDKTAITTGKWRTTSGETTVGSGAYSDYIPVDADTDYYVTNLVSLPSFNSAVAYNNAKTAIDYINLPRNTSNGAIHTPANCAYIILNIVTANADTVSCVKGSTAKPYEPYGYKLDIKSASTTTPVYLGEVESTRRIKQLVLTGDEYWVYQANNLRFVMTINNIVVSGLRATPFFCTHYIPISDGRPIEDVPLNASYLAAVEPNTATLNIKIDTYTTAADFKAYLAAQYANGTPVTIWYVLANETTGIVNEPIRKIGGYADTLTATQAGVEIPTDRGRNTIDVDTTLKPSEFYMKWKER